MGLAYGFFAPLTGFMGSADVDGVAKDMRLASGYVWSVPILFDLSPEQIAETGIAEGQTILLTYQGQPLATMDVEEIYDYDKSFLAGQIYGTTEDAHPGVRRTFAYQDRFLGGPITLVNPRSCRSVRPFLFTPARCGRRSGTRGKRVVAYQSPTCPTWPEWLMKSAGSPPETMVSVSAASGEEGGRLIDEAYPGPGHAAGGGYFLPAVQNVDPAVGHALRRPREAVFHALCAEPRLPHHMFGRDHAGVGSTTTIRRPRISRRSPTRDQACADPRVVLLPPLRARYERLCGHRPKDPTAERGSGA